MHLLLSVENKLNDLQIAIPQEWKQKSSGREDFELFPRKCSLLSTTQNDKLLWLFLLQRHLLRHF